MLIYLKKVLRDLNTIVKEGWIQRSLLNVDPVSSVSFPVKVGHDEIESCSNSCEIQSNILIDQVKLHLLL